MGVLTTDFNAHGAQNLDLVSFRLLVPSFSPWTIPKVRKVDSSQFALLRRASSLERYTFAQWHTGNASEAF